MGSFWPKYIMLELKKYRGVMFVSTEDWCKIWRKPDLCFQKWQEDVRDLANFYRLKNSDFILESKMAELNQNETSKQLDWPDAVWKTLFYLGIKSIAQLTKIFTHVLQNHCS